MDRGAWRVTVLGVTRELQRVGPSKRYSQGKLEGLLTHSQAGQGRAELSITSMLLTLPPCLGCLRCCTASSLLRRVMFPVSVTQQSPAAVSMETYHVTLTLPPTQVEGV